MAQPGVRAPAQEALDKVRQHGRLTPTHWKALARFVAAQHVRTPARFLEMMQRWTVDLKPVIQTTLRSSVAKIEQIRHGDTPLIPRTPTHEEYLPSRVTVRKSDSGGGESGLEVVAGRGLWLFAIRHLLTSTLRAREPQMDGAERAERRGMDDQRRRSYTSQLVRSWTIRLQGWLG